MADRLSFHILVIIIAAARELDPVSFDHGGRLGWDSNESIAPLALISSAWYEAATFCLYRSVAILGGRTAELFLRTLRERPARAHLVRSLVIALDADAEEPRSEEESGDPCEESSELVEILEACSNVETLQVRPLDPSARPRLLAAIASKALTSLVGSPRRDTTGSALFHHHDILTLATPTLQHLELDFSATSTPSAESPPPFPLPILPALSLTELHLVCCGETDDIFHPIASAGPTLEVLDLYFESVFDSALAAAALLPSSRTLQRLKYITNLPNEALHRLPLTSTPVLDVLLPHFLRLTHLSTSATDISSLSLFRRLPPSLRHLEVQSLSLSPAFFYTEDMARDLEDNEVGVTLETFGLRDGSSTAVQVKAMDRACTARGVSFKFYPD